MENFNLKQYFYEKRAQGVTVGRIAELLDISVEELMEQVNGAKIMEKPAEKKPEPAKEPEKPAEKDPEPIKKPEKPVEEPKPAEEPEDDSQSWLED